MKEANSGLIVQKTQPCSTAQRLGAHKMRRLGAQNVMAQLLGDGKV